MPIVNLHHSDLFVTQHSIYYFIRKADPGKATDEKPSLEAGR
jgi:hypothetical protein